MESYAAQVESFEQQFNRENGEYEVHFFIFVAPLCITSLLFVSFDS